MNAILLASLICLFGAASVLAAPLRVATFAIEAAPPAGSPLCNGSVAPVKTVVTPLMARGVVLSGSGAPLVLCAFDWGGIGNESQDAFRAALAEAIEPPPTPGFRRDGSRGGERGNSIYQLSRDLRPAGSLRPATLAPPGSVARCDGAWARPRVQPYLVAEAGA